MSRYCWTCGFVLLAAIATNPQVILDISCENIGNKEVTQPAPFLEYLRQAEVGHEYEQNSVARSCAAGGVVPNNDAGAIRWCLQAAPQGDR